MGRRISKGSIKYVYDSNGRLFNQSNGIKFIYDQTGVAGFTYNNETYYYRKDIQGNIIGIINSSGDFIARYYYDAWGNHKVLDASGAVITSATHVGNLNPFRYRGYYYDTETGLYYLQSRYYDPEVGRFISQDNIEFADPYEQDGLNLYAYCGNNPVMNIDTTGSFFLSLLAAMAIGALLGGLTGGVSAVIKGDKFLSGFLSGALIGGALGGAFVLGGATMFALAGKTVAGFIVANTVATKAILLASTLTASIMVSAGAGMGAYAIRESMNGREIDNKELLRQGFITGIKGGYSYAVGMALATTGSLDYLLKGIEWGIGHKIVMGFMRGIVSFIFQFPLKFGLK